MSKKILSILILIVIASTGYKISKNISGTIYKYTGSNENWTCEYIIKRKGDFKANTFVAKYNKDKSNLSSNKSLTVSYETSAGKARQTYILEQLEDKENFTISTKDNGALENENETIFAEIDLDGEIEKIELNKTK